MFIEDYKSSRTTNKLLPKYHLVGLILNLKIQLLTTFEIIILPQKIRKNI